MKREAVGRRRLTTAREVIITRGREREYRMTRGGQRGAIPIQRKSEQTSHKKMHAVKNKKIKKRGRGLKSLNCYL